MESAPTYQLKKYSKFIGFIFVCFRLFLLIFVYFCSVIILTNRDENAIFKLRKTLFLVTYVANDFIAPVCISESWEELNGRLMENPNSLSFSMERLYKKEAA